MKHNDQDSAAIIRTLEDNYFQGIYEGNLRALQNILNPGALLFGDVKGEPYAKTLEQYLDGVKHRVSPKDQGTPFKGTIRSISITNSIAVANVHVKMYTFEYEEYLSLHKINGQWMIVNKMLTDTAE